MTLLLSQRIGCRSDTSTYAANTEVAAALMPYRKLDGVEILPAGSMNRSDQPAKTSQGSLFLARLLQLIGQNAFELWFNPRTNVEIDCDTIRVLVDNDFLADCIRSFCFPEIRQAANELYGPAIKIAISVAVIPAESLASAEKSCVQGSDSKVGTDAAEESTAASMSQQQAEQRSSLFMLTKSTMLSHVKCVPSTNASLPMKITEPKTTQNATLTSPGNKPVPTFLTGGSNRLACTAAEMVLERPGELGPLFVHGPNGCGKTHLCKTLREQFRARHRFRRVMYMTAEQFTIDFTESTRGAGFAAFRKKYRDVDVLIIDDIQFFVGKSQTLAELRNTIDDLLSRRRQVVFAADRSLAELVSLGSDLHARLSGGIACAIQLLDVELRRDLLSNLCKQHNVRLSDSTLDALAEKTNGDGRSIYGIVFRLMAQQRSNGGSISREEAINCTLDLIRAGQPVVRLTDIERVVCDSFGLEPKTLKAKGRSKSISGPRMLAMFLARKHTMAAYSEIGEFFGNRQHSTVISAQKRVEDWIAANETLAHRSGSVSVRDLVRNAESMLHVG